MLKFDTSMARTLPVESKFSIALYIVAKSVEVSWKTPWASKGEEFGAAFEKLYSSD